MITTKMISHRLPCRMRKVHLLRNPAQRRNACGSVSSTSAENHPARCYRDRLSGAGCPGRMVMSKFCLEKPALPTDTPQPTTAPQGSSPLLHYRSGLTREEFIVQWLFPSPPGADPTDSPRPATHPAIIGLRDPERRYVFGIAESSGLKPQTL